jgi:hypothetical protein
MSSRALVLVLALSSLAPAARAQSRGNMRMTLTFNPTPSPAWEPGVPITLDADARRSPEIGREDIFAVERYGQRPRSGGQLLDFTAVDVRVGEVILVQGYMCAYGGSGDCYPSDKDNPPSCAAAVRVLGGLRPSCSPVFTWTGGSGNGGVSCRAQCL